MNPKSAKLILIPQHRWENGVPPEPVGIVLKEIQRLVSAAVSLAFCASSRRRGRPPYWLTRATDVRLANYENGERVVLHFQAPTLGEAASELYAQQELWPSRPNEADTGFDLLGDVLQDIEQGNPESDRFDVGFLQEVQHFRKVLEGPFQEIQLESRRYRKEHPARFNRQVLQQAQQLSAQTPPPRQVRVVGTLDMVRASTQTFALKLSTGEEVRGIWIGGPIEKLGNWLNKPVLVIGRAVYRPSGRPFRIEAQWMQEAKEEKPFFQFLPEGRSQDLKQLLRVQARRKPGIQAILGKWPGQETEAQVRQALEELS